MLERPSADDLHRLAAEWNFTIAPSELDEYLGLADSVMATIDGLEPDLRAAASDSGSAAAARRDPGGPLGEAEDPLNAIVRRCSVQGTGDSDGRLRGKRVAVKDNISIAGIPLTGASAALRDYIPTEDATVVERILAAGGEIVAVTNMDLLSCSAGGESSIYGPTQNPFDLSRAAGGSSSGSAAGLHYDWIDVSLGCDQGGSIRVPASWCGVVGLKPTFSLVPYTGILGLDATFDFCGPMALTVTDVATMLQVIAGPDGEDPRQRSVITEDYIAASEDAPPTLAGVSVGVVAEAVSPTVGITEGMVAATARFAGRLADLGASVATVSVPDHLTGAPVVFDATAESLDAVVRSGGNGYQLGGRLSPQLALTLASGLERSAQELSPQVKILLILGTFLNRTYHGALYAAGHNRKRALRSAYDRAFEDHDVLLTPTVPWTAHELRPDATIGEHVQRGWDNLVNTSLFDLTGHPAITIPAEEDAGLPAGMQLIAPHFQDARLLSIARTYERAHGWLPGKAVF
jgi:amidase